MMNVNNRQSVGEKRELETNESAVCRIHILFIKSAKVFQLVCLGIEAL